MDKKKKFIIYGVAAVIVIVLIIVFTSKGKDGYVPQTVKVQEGQFEIVVSTTGELEAESNIKIEGPAGLRARNVRIGDVTIQDLVPEGTVVKEGDYVAQLDRSSAENSLKDIEDEHEALVAKYESSLLDTSLSLRTLRDDMVNQQFTIEEARIAVEQAIYEPPATQRSYQNTLDKAMRSYEQLVSNYDLKVEQAKSTVNDVYLELNRKTRQLEEYRDVISQFTVYAPASGMVVYERDWSGDKRRIGSTISGWDLVVANLPDLKNMLSKTYVNEIDISKVQVGQEVRLGVDAFPEKSYTGRVIEVSNIGEQLKNADAKVFEVVIKVDGQDEILRPAMTTSNQIITASIDNALFVPAESIFETDSITYVYRTNGTRQVVLCGEANDNYRVILQGLEKGQEIYLSMPQNANKFKLVGEDIIPLVKAQIEEKAKARQQSEEAEKEQQGRHGRRGGMPGGQMPEGMTLPEGVTLPEGMTMPEGGQMPQGMPAGGQRPAGGRGAGQRPAGGQMPQGNAN